MRRFRRWIFLSNQPREEQSGDSSSEQGSEENAVVEEHSSSEGEDEATPAQSYASLLSALKPRVHSEQRPSKRRKTEHANEASESVTVNHSRGATREEDVTADGSDISEFSEVTEHDEPLEEQEQEQDSDDEDVIQQDPFERHYGNIVDEELGAGIQALTEKATLGKENIVKGIRKLTMSYSSLFTKDIKSAQNLKIKKRLADVGAAVQSTLNDEEADLCREVFSYKDILCGFRTPTNATQLHAITSLHVLNHIYKTRDRVLKNNAKLGQDTEGEAEYRDQGFTRPKVLILVPTKQACVRYVQSIVTLSEPDQQENRGRFMDQFSQPDNESLETRPDDFRELFGGNHDEDFRVGLKFTRKTIKFFSGFYNSDIILASPLGLMRTIQTGGGKKDEKRTHDADFLSSIEIVVMDQTNALEMQNWQHVDYVFSHLNLLPKDSHGCDFARARTWYLDGKAKYLRQSIILSDYLTPSISSLASTHLQNVAGRVKYTPNYEGSMLKVSPAMPMALTQTFLRFASPNPQADSDARFKFFTATILPGLLRSSKQSRGTLIFTPTYLDFVRLRNHFSTAQETTSLPFGTVSEYSARGEVARARAHFLNGRHNILLYSERAHHYFRYKLKGVRRIIFYGVPENPIFWSEMLEALAVNAQKDPEWTTSQRGKQGKGLVRALFSKWDVMKLERIVGTERVGRLVSEKEGDVFEFA